MDSLSFAGVDGRSFLMAYPAEEKSAIETLATASNRRQLEALLKEISGRDWTLKLNAKEGLTTKQSNKPAPPPGNDFKDEPLIQEALEMFKGQIKS